MNVTNTLGIEYHDTILANELLNTLKKEMLPEGFAEVLDPYNRILTDEGLQKLLSMNLYSNIRWSEAFDCDNFAIVLWGIKQSLAPEAALGLALAKNTLTGAKHALCFYINKDENLMFIEPQTNKTQISPFNNSVWKPYCLIM